MSGYSKYDFDMLRYLRFPSMTDTDIMREYVKVLHDIEQMACKADEATYAEYSEPLIEAEQYLAGYLARKVCYEHGLEV